MSYIVHLHCGVNVQEYTAGRDIQCTVILFDVLKVVHWYICKMVGLCVKC